MSESVMTFAEALYNQKEDAPRVSFDQSFRGVTYGRTQDGYFIVNTGNAVRDSVVSVLLNEIGIDNFSNAVSAMKGGEYGKATRQALIGITQAALVLIPGVNVARGVFVGGRAATAAFRAASASGGVSRAVGGRLLQVPRSAKYALNQRVTQPTRLKGYTSMIPRYGSTARQLREGRRQGIALDAAGRFRAGYGTGVFAKAPATPPTRMQARSAQRAQIRSTFDANAAKKGGPPVWVQRQRYMVGRDPVKGGMGSGPGFATSPLATRATAGAYAGLGGVGYQTQQRVKSSRELVEERLMQQEVAAEAETADKIRQGTVQQAIDDAINEIGPGGDQPAADLETDFNSTIGALNFQYDRAVAELRSMYQLAETDDEKARLRFILSDIEAQHMAGRSAITNVFERKRAEVAKLTEQSRENTLKAAQKAFDLYEISASQLKDMLEADRQKTTQEIYGFGAAQARDQSEYVQLLSAMAPVAQQSRQAIGDIGTEGLEWLGAVMGEQTAARDADLQRLSMSTRAAAISQHQKQVDDRVNAERMALASAIQSMRERQASESGAMQRAMLGQQDQGSYGPLQMREYLVDAVLKTGDPALAIREYRINFAGKPNPLGGVYPDTPPADLLKAIEDAAIKYDALMKFEEAKSFQERTDFEEQVRRRQQQSGNQGG